MLSSQEGKAGARAFRSEHRLVMGDGDERARVDAVPHALGHEHVAEPQPGRGIGGELCRVLDFPLRDEESRRLDHSVS